MSNAGEILEWFNYDEIFTNPGALNLNKSKYQDELDNDSKALIPEILKGDLMAMFKLGEMIGYKANDASLWFKSEKHREYKYNSWILMGLGFKQIYPSYQKEILAMAESLGIDINDEKTMNDLRNGFYTDKETLVMDKFVSLGIIKNPVDFDKAKPTNSEFLVTLADKHRLDNNKVHA